MFSSPGVLRGLQVGCIAVSVVLVFLECEGINLCPPSAACGHAMFREEVFMHCISISLIYPLTEVSKEVFIRCILTSLIYPLIEVSKDVSRFLQLMTACRFKAPLLPVTQFKLNTQLPPHKK